MLKTRQWIWVLLLLGLQACTSLQQNFATPDVTLVSIKALPSNQLEQRFALGLRITNPNPVALKLRGMRYKVDVEGCALVSGVAADVKPIAAYGEQLVTVQASLNLFQGARFLAAVMTKPKDALQYSMEASLDTGLPIIGRVPVTHSGTISLDGLRSR